MKKKEAISLHTNKILIFLQNYAVYFNIQRETMKRFWILCCVLPTVASALHCCRRAHWPVYVCAEANLVVVSRQKVECKKAQPKEVMMPQLTTVRGRCRQKQKKVVVVTLVDATGKLTITYRMMRDAPRASPPVVSSRAMFCRTFSRRMFAHSYVFSGMLSEKPHPAF